MATFSITQRNMQHAIDIARQLVRIAQDVTAPVQTQTKATPAGDTQRLRGIPAIGRGVAGAIPGTKPDAR